MSCMDAPLPPVVPFTKTVMVVAAALYDADGRILIQEYLKPAFPGHWEFPGGKIEAGELPEDALVRELREELGIITCVNCLQPCVCGNVCACHFAALCYQAMAGPRTRRRARA
jgi:ADP-ribose pyrophosphatase YjhB (NUDIX family)